MDITAVESTTLATVVYDEPWELWQLEFRSGAVYEYFGVAGTVHQELLAAPSKGSYFNRAIRDRFPYRRIRNVRTDAAKKAVAAGDQR